MKEAGRTLAVSQFTPAPSPTGRSRWAWKGIALF